MFDGLEGVYNIFIYGCDQKEYDDILHKCLLRAVEARITLDKKCKFSKTEIKLLGHISSYAGNKPDPERISAIIRMAAPINASELRYF